MNRLIQMVKDLGYERDKLQDFVKQQQYYERGERIAGRELERDRIASQEKERELERDRISAQEKERADKLAAQEKDGEIELAMIAAKEAKADKDRELERERIAAEEAKIAADERLEMARIEGIAEQAERDRELKRTELETDRESKMSSEIELEKFKHSFEMKHLELMGQLEVQRATYKTELEKQKSEKLAHARDPKLPYFEESKDKMDSYLSRFEKYATANKWDKNVLAAYFECIAEGSRTRCI